MEKEIEKKVMNLEKKPLGELRKIWKKVYGEEAPGYSKKYLIPRLAYRMQEKEYGEMSRKGTKRLEYSLSYNSPNAIRYVFMAIAGQ